MTDSQQQHQIIPPMEPVQPTGRDGMTWQEVIKGLRDVLADESEDAVQRAWQRSRIYDAIDLMEANSLTEHTPGAEPLSPAAQAVLDAANGRSSYGPDDCLNESRWIVAAALRAAAAAADQLAQTPIVIGEPLRGNIAKDAAVVHVADLFAIAAELENTNG